MDIKGFTNFLVLILFSAVTLTTVFLPDSTAQDYTQMSLPNGAKARLAKGPILDIAYSPDSKRFAVSSRMGVWLYNAQSGEELALFTRHIGEVNSVSFSKVNSVSFSPDGKMLVSGDTEGKVTLWDTATGTLKHTFTGHTGTVNSVSFSPDGRTVASAGVDKTIHLWDVSTLSLKHIFFGGVHFNTLTIVLFSPDGKTLGCVYIL